MPGEVRARAHYLSGNLAFLDGDYEDAVTAYDRALVLTPGEADSGDPVGRDAAWNRAIALRRIDDKKDAGPGRVAAGRRAAPTPRANPTGAVGRTRPETRAGRDGGAPEGGA